METSYNSKNNPSNPVQQRKSFNPSQPSSKKKNIPIPRSNQITYLGIILDKRHSLTKHIQTTTKLKIQILKSIHISTDTSLKIKKSFNKFVLTIAHPSSSLTSQNTTKKKEQKKRNTKLTSKTRKLGTFFVFLAVTFQ